MAATLSTLEAGSSHGKCPQLLNAVLQFRDMILQVLCDLSVGDWVIDALNEQRRCRDILGIVELYR